MKRTLSDTRTDQEIIMAIVEAACAYRDAVSEVMPIEFEERLVLAVDAYRRRILENDAIDHKKLRAP